jgi:hypothetical protein
MKTLWIIVLISLFDSPGRAQDSTRLKRYEYVIGASLAFSLIDYVGWSAVRQADDWNPSKHDQLLYHFCLGALQTAITYFIYKELGLPSAISFNLMWWTWCDDLGYYGWGYALNPARWPNRNSRLLHDDGITWASWTPIGLLRPYGQPVSGSSLIAQAIVGFSISMPILW